jgi:peptidoglycan/xylan/chitin deacetylase (PgdA/CDA1 family)
MGHPLTIVTYHYVRDMANARWPRLKALDVRRFREQVLALRAKGTIVSMEQVLGHLDGSCPRLPENATLLTFDDGYLDHYLHVFPILDSLGISGAFYPPARAVLEGRLLDVNKIHIILASVPDCGPVVARLLALLDLHADAHGMGPAREIQARLALPGRFDPPDIMFIKRALQREIPEPLRGKLVDTLFAEFAGVPENVLAREMYMDREQLKTLVRHGMHVGSHGHGHCWLSRLDKAGKEHEVQSSLEFLSALGADTSRWTISYPYGDYDAGTLETVRAAGGVLGLSTRRGVADLESDPLLALPRLDTNDIPM